MQIHRHMGDGEGWATFDGAETRLLTAREERELLCELAECRRELAGALAEIPGIEPPQGMDDPKDLAHYIARTCAGDGPTGARLGAIYHRYGEIRTRLAMANLRLVAHVAKKFRERGVAYSDLVQEGFCGLLEAIDRFDVGHGTKLSTYATWWIRQAIQRAVAAGAYPVRLSPRHLRQLAQGQDDLDGPVPAGAGEVREPGAPSAEMIQHIHTATRPAISLDSSIDPDSDFSLLQTMSDPEGDRTGEVDTDEAIGRLMRTLRPREQEVLSLRFGLGGKPKLSLSQVGKVLDVSKERVRQIQDRALEKLRGLAGEADLSDALAVGA
jgi:RNA polymerase primary sigma factor